jgi:hypothetical protein
MRKLTTASAVITVLAVPIFGAALAASPSLAADHTAVSDGAFTKLAAVSAASSTDAWAVGFQTRPGEHNLGLTRHWNGTRWRTVPSAHPGDYSFLWGVADISSSDAWAVGETLGGATDLPFAEHWNGSSWQVVPIHNGPGLGKLQAVSANGPDDVWMVGTGYPAPKQTPQMFILHWNGTWLHRVRPGHPAHNKTTTLTGISAAAANDIWAVGAHGRHGTTNLPLLEHYDGARWSVVGGDPDVGSSTNLSGVAAISTTSAWAAGWHAADGQPTVATFAEHWDGAQWTQSPTISPGYSAEFTSISAVADDDVWAVGSWVKSEHNRRTRPLIEHWDGHAWSIVHAPAGGPGMNSTVESVSMSSATAGLAVGTSTNGADTTWYNVHWDGASWTRP